MSKTYKQRSIQATKEQIERLLNPCGKNMRTRLNNPLCKVYPGTGSEVDFLCRGCWLEDDSEWFGCIHSETHNRIVRYPETPSDFEQCRIRAEFLQHWLPYLEKIPSIYFNPRIWINFDNFLPIGWRDWTPDETD